MPKESVIAFPIQKNEAEQAMLINCDFVKSRLPDGNTTAICEETSNIKDQYTCYKNMLKPGRLST